MSIKTLSPIYRNKVDFVLQNLDKGSGKKILDVGCGYGEYLSPLRQKGFIAFGIDIDKGALKSQDNVICADVRKIPIKSSIFDIVVCVDVLEHVNNDDETLKEIKRILRKGGLLIITVPSSDFPFTYDPINVFLGLFNKHISIGMWAWEHKRLYTEEGIENLLKENNFMIMKFENRSHAFIAAFVNYIPYIFVHVLSPIFKRLEKGSLKKKKEQYIIHKLFEILNNIDKKYFSHTKGVNLCFVTQKI